MLINLFTLDDADQETRVGTFTLESCFDTGLDETDPEMIDARAALEREGVYYGGGGAFPRYVMRLTVAADRPRPQHRDETAPRGWSAVEGGPETGT